MHLLLNLHLHVAKTLLHEQGCFQNWPLFQEGSYKGYFTRISQGQRVRQIHTDEGRAFLVYGAEPKKDLNPMNLQSTSKTQIHITSLHSSSAMAIVSSSSPQKLGCVCYTMLLQKGSELPGKSLKSLEPSTLNLKPCLDPKEPTSLGFLIMNSLYSP